MNPNLIGTILFQSDNWFKNVDISICFEEVGQYYKGLLEDKRSQECISNDLAKGKQQVNFVVEALTRKKFNFQSIKRKIKISALTKDVPIEFILRQLFRQYSPQGFRIQDSQIDEEFFKILSRLQTEIVRIQMRCCNIGNSLPKGIQHLDTQNLKTIKVMHDPINNKGLKQLFSLNLPYLSNIIIFNTNSTPDIWKLLQKINTKTGFKLVYVLQTQPNSTIKKIIRDFFKSFSFGVLGTKDTYFYFNELSKMQINFVKQQMVVKDINTSRENQHKLTPQNTVSLFKKISY